MAPMSATVDQNNSLAWGVIALMIVILVIAWVGLYLASTPISGL